MDNHYPTPKNFAKSIGVPTKTQHALAYVRPDCHYPQQMAEDLKKLRDEIDSIDRVIVQRLNDRIKLACEIGKIKLKQGCEV